MKSPSRIDDTFPDRLTARDWIESKTGHRARVVTTPKKDSEHGEPLYRLEYLSVVKSRGTWTRDEFVELGCRYLGELVK